MTLPFSLAFTNAVTTAPCRVVYITLPGAPCAVTVL